MKIEYTGVKSIEVVLPVKRDAQQKQLRLRVVSTPKPALAQLLGHLGLQLPKGARQIANVVPKTSL